MEHALSKVLQTMAAMEALPREARTKDWYDLQIHYVRMIMSWASGEAAVLEREAEYARDRSKS